MNDVRRLTDRAILHVDMDAFFVSVELLDHPELKGRPVVVGGVGTRGVVAAASYEARVFGIHSAMSSVEAQRRCPDAVFIRGRHDRYSRVSRQIMEILARFASKVEPVSLDEAFLDVTGSRLLRRPFESLGHAIRDAILTEVQLTCSVGIAPGKLVAKLASEAAKPKVTASGFEPGAGVVVVEPNDVVEFLDPQPVGNLWGVGPVTASRLDALGVSTVGDLARLPREAVVATLGSKVGGQLHSLANGVDIRDVVPDRPTKSLGHEETFVADLHTRRELEREVVRLSDAVASRLRARDLAGRTITLKIRFGDFRSVTRSSTLTVPVDDAAAIAEAAKTMLARIDPGPGVRLVGVSVDGLVDGTSRQLTFDDMTRGGQAGELSCAIDRVRERFGADAIGPAVAVGEGRLRVKRNGDKQWGPTEGRVVDTEMLCEDGFR